MKHNMFAVIAAIAMMAGSAQAQDASQSQHYGSVFPDLRVYQTFDVGRYEKNFVASLQDSVPTVVESALGQVTMLRLAQPGLRSKKLRTAIHELVIYGDTPGVRYRAYLADAVFGNPQMFSGIAYGSYATADDLFEAIARKLDEAIFASN